jgi:ADP-heptose:LPS heptosyltransferase
MKSWRISLTDMSGIVPGVKKIAVLRANALGDYMFILPALEALRKTYPAAEIVLLGQQWHEAFLKGRPGPVDRVIVVPFLRGIYAPPGSSENAEQIEAFFAAMRNERFDIAVQLFGGGRHSNPFIQKLAARVSIGMKAADAEPLDRWVPYIYYHSEILRFLEVVSLAGAVPAAIEPRLAVTAADRDEACHLLPSLNSAPVAVLHPGGTDPRRRWPAEKFAAVGDALAEAGLRIVITGSDRELSTADAVCRCMHAKAENLCGRSSLQELAGLLSYSRLTVANDTGPLHLARAVGTATVGIYWVGNLINAGPVTAARHRSHLSWRLTCPVCGKNCIAETCTHRASFVADVPASEVTASALELV